MFVEVTIYYNAFKIAQNDQVTYFYSDAEKTIQTDNLDDFYDCMGNVHAHNIRIIALSIINKMPYYFSNTSTPNIILRSDGWRRDFSQQDIMMYPPGYDFNAVEEFEVSDESVHFSDTLQALFDDILLSNKF